MDLLEWLRAQGVSASLDTEPTKMGTAETVSVVVAGAAALRGAFVVLREWIRARRTTVSVKTPEGLEFRITSSTSDEALADLVGQIQCQSGTGDDADD
jgi:hypothetical protein